MVTGELHPNFDFFVLNLALQIFIIGLFVVILGELYEVFRAVTVERSRRFLYSLFHVKNLKSCQKKEIYIFFKVLPY